MKDYIAYPKRNGYRSTHVISRHDAPEAGLSNLFCETQVRTRLQHAWATALETYDVISRSALKFGGGSEDEERLFALISNAFAMKEMSPLVPDTPASEDELRQEVAALNNRLFAIEKLRACSDSVTIVSQQGVLFGRCALPYGHRLRNPEDRFVRLRYGRRSRGKSDVCEAGEDEEGSSGCSAG